MKKTMKTKIKTLLCALMFTLLFATTVCAQETTEESGSNEEAVVELSRNKTISATLDADGDIYKVMTAAKKKAYYICVNSPAEDAMSIAVYKKAIDDKSEENRGVLYEGENCFNMTLKPNETYYIIVKSKSDLVEGESLDYKIGFYECVKAIKKDKPKGLKVTSKSGHAEILFNNTFKYDGIQIYRSTSKKSGYKKVKTVKYNSFYYTYGNFALTDAKVKKGKTYYYKIRYYEKDGNKTYYSKWSAIKKIKVK